MYGNLEKKKRIMRFSLYLSSPSSNPPGRLEARSGGFCVLFFLRVEGGGCDEMGGK